MNRYFRNPVARASGMCIEVPAAAMFVLRVTGAVVAPLGSLIGGRVYG